MQQLMLLLPMGSRCRVVPLDNWDIAPTPPPRYYKRNKAPRSTHVHLDDIKHPSTKDASQTVNPSSQYTEDTRHLRTVRGTFNNLST